MGLVIDVIWQLGDSENRQILPSVRFAVKRHSKGVLTHPALFNMVGQTVTTVIVGTFLRKSWKHAEAAVR
jgi:hypothetical protein